MQQFAGKVAVITGAGSGFGAAFARQAQRLGMRLVLADVQADALDRQVSALGERGADVLGVRCDVSSDADVGRLARAAYDRFGAVNLLVNNAGVAGTGGYLWENSEADWRWTLGVNLMGVANGIRHFVPRMIAAGLDQDSGHIVNSASIAGWLCAPLLGVYNASKAAVIALSETLAQEHAAQGIQVTALAEVFEKFPQMRYAIEIKKSGIPVEQPLCDLIRQYKMEEKVLVASFHDEVMQNFRATCPEVATSASRGEVTKFVILGKLFLSGLVAPGYESIQPPFDPEESYNIPIMTRRFIRESHRKNIKVEPWTVDDPELMERYIEWGVDGIITDRPDLMVEILGR
mgnify:CR=1 FL=1